MADLSRKYEKRYFLAEQERVRVLTELDKIGEPYRTLLYKRYVENKDLNSIAEEMFCSYSTIAKLHGIALIVYERRNKND